MIEEKTFDYFSIKIEKILEEAGEYGIKSVAILLEDNPLTEEETKNILWNNIGPVGVLTLLEYARMKFFIEMVIKK